MVGRKRELIKEAQTTKDTLERVKELVRSGINQEELLQVLDYAIGEINFNVSMNK